MSVHLRSCLVVWSVHLYVRLICTLLDSKISADGTRIPYSTVVEKAASALTASKDMYTFHVLDLTTPLPLSNIIEKSFNFIFIT